MVVSQGFYRKIKDWIYSEEHNGITFRPFQTNGNPYKAKCFLVCAYPDTRLNVSDQEAALYAEALLDRALFWHLYGEQCDSKEISAIREFTDWYEESTESPLIVAYMNTLQTNGLTALKLARKQAPKDFSKGEKMFNEVLLEFLPDCLIIQGNEALKMFRKQYSDIMIDYHQSIISARELEQVGPFAEIRLLNGRIIYVFASRHLSTYNEQAMQSLKHNVEKIVKSEQ